MQDCRHDITVEEANSPALCRVLGERPDVAPRAVGRKKDAKDKETARVSDAFDRLLPHMTRERLTQLLGGKEKLSADNDFGNVSAWRELH